MNFFLKVYNFLCLFPYCRALHNIMLFSSQSFILSDSFSNLHFFTQHPLTPLPPITLFIITHHVYIIKKGNTKSTEGTNYYKLYGVLCCTVLKLCISRAEAAHHVYTYVFRQSESTENIEYSHHYEAIYFYFERKNGK